MTDAQFTAFVSVIKWELEKFTPYDTGNLAKNATRSESLGSDKARIYVDTNIAPYFKYVNFYQTLVNGKPNPNHEYFQKGIKSAVERAAKMSGGHVTYE